MGGAKLFCMLSEGSVMKYALIDFEHSDHTLDTLY